MKLTSQQKQIIRNTIRTLNRISRHGGQAHGVTRHLGLCHNALERIPKDVFKTGYVGWIRGVYSRWPLYSGAIAYPVPTEWECEPRFAEIRAKEAYNYSVDKYEGDYGSMRRSLARHLAKELGKLL